MAFIAFAEVVDVIPEILTTPETTITSEPTSSHLESTEVITTNTLQTTEVLTLPQTTEGTAVEKFHIKEMIILLQATHAAVCWCIAKQQKQQSLASQRHFGICYNIYQRRVIETSLFNGSQDLYDKKRQTNSQVFLNQRIGLYTVFGA